MTCRRVACGVLLTTDALLPQGSTDFPPLGGEMHVQTLLGSQGVANRLTGSVRYASGVHSARLPCACVAIGQLSGALLFEGPAQGAALTLCCRQWLGSMLLPRELDQLLLRAVRFAPHCNINISAGAAAQQGQRHGDGD